MKLKRIFTHWKVLLLLFFLLFSLISIFSLSPPWFQEQGVSIRGVDANSSALEAGIHNPTGRTTPLEREQVIALNGKRVTSVEEFTFIESTLAPNRSALVQTTKQVYNIVPTVNGQGKPTLGLRVTTAPTTNLRKGLDLEGGTRVLLKPAEAISSEDMHITMDSLSERLNVYGLSDVVIRESTDLSGDKYILIEIAGVTEDEVKQLLASQGKFEAKIANQTVFSGGKKDITYVCRSAECSGIDPRRGCSKTAEGTACGFFFSISLSPEAAARQANLTKNLQIINEDGQTYLSEDLILYLDDIRVDSLRIGAELRGRETTEIQISGSGAGLTPQEGQQVTLQNMKKLQTIIFTGSLPVKLEVVKMDTISPTLGKEFLQNVIMVGILALLAVSVVVFIRYRRPIIVIPMALSLIAEVVMLLGFAALAGWNLDLIAIAALIIVVGTGVDHLIVITDEALRGHFVGSWKQRIKNALFIIVGAYLTNLSGMLPLLWAGAGLVKGFALTTIVGLSFGVLIARPAYAAIIEILAEE